MGTETTMLHLTYLMPALPLAGFVVLALLGRKIGDPWAGIVGTFTVGASFVVALLTTSGLLGRASGTARENTQSLFTWIHAGPLDVHASLLADPLSMTMVLFVTGISTLIHLYSIGYMKGDQDYSKFFLYLNLFVASMLLLFGWESPGHFCRMGRCWGLFVLAGRVLVRS